MAKLLGDHEGVATEREGDVVVPSAPASSLEVVEAQLALHVLVDALGPPALLEDAHHLLGAELPGDRDQREVGGLGLGLGPFDDQVLLDAGNANATPSESRAEGSRAALAPRDATECCLGQRF